METVADVVLEVGDVIAWDEKYWEIDGVTENQYFMGKNDSTTTAKEDKTIGDMVVGDPEYGTPMQIGGYQEVFGSSLSIIVNAHQSRRSKLKIEQIRNGFTRTSKGPGVRGI